MQTKFWAIVLILICTIFTSTAQIFLKKGSALLPNLLTNTPLIIGCALYGVGAIIFILALRGGDVTILYPIIATSYVWVNILAILFLNEKIPLLRWLGVILIMIGISTMGYASQQSQKTEVIL
ncbi:EamA family transporter [Candidatus Woesearchaeota archaeon]|nr:EamA family transporter [Candidatus Woesearchaeota archaeon]